MQAARVNHEAGRSIILRAQVTQPGLDRLRLELPAGWIVYASPYGLTFEHPKDRKLIIATTGEEADGRLWAHASISARRMPSYADLCFVKEHVLGPDLKAIQVFPPRAEHVSIHETCLHLWACLEADPIPDFRGYVPGIGATI